MILGTKLLCFSHQYFPSLRDQKFCVCDCRSHRPFPSELKFLLLMKRLLPWTSLMFTPSDVCPMFLVNFMVSTVALTLILLSYPITKRVVLA